MHSALSSASPLRWATLRAAGVIVAGALCACAGPAFAAGPTVASLAGVYDGGQMEIAAGLELKADGTFHYELSYGALDEEATGQWSVSGGHVQLTSNHVTPPRFTIVSQQKGADGTLRITLDFKDPYDQQYFDALIEKSGGEREMQQLGIDGLSWSFAPGAPPASVRLVYGVYQIASDELKLDPNSGYEIKYHFEPNDLGKADFQAAPLKIVNGELWLDRYGRTLKFKRGKR